MIEGIKVKNMEAKIPLYADDMVYYLRSPEVSIMAWSDLIRDLGPVAVYEINQSKSILSGFNISEPGKQAILAVILGKLQDERMEYLGIKIF